MFAVQSGDDLQGAWGLGDQGSPPEGDGRSDHQRQVSPLPPHLWALDFCADFSSPPALTETCVSLSRGHQTPSTCCRR